MSSQKRRHTTTSRNVMSARGVRAAALASSAMAGAIAVVINAPQAAADGSDAQLVSASATSLQPVIDQILSEQQAAIASDSALPFSTPDNIAQLPTIVQNTNYELLEILLSQANNTSNFGILFNTPEVVAGDAADPRQFMGFYDADSFYPVVEGLNPNASYEITGTVGAGSGAFSITENAAVLGGPNGFQSIPGPTLQIDHNLTVNPDGTFTVFIGPTEPSGAVNYLDDTGYNSLIIRDKLADLAQGATRLEFQCVADCPAAAPGVTSTDLSSTEISTLLHVVALGLPAFNNFNIVEEAEKAGIQFPANTMSDFTNEGVQGGFPGQALSAGNFDLQPDQALIVKVPDIEAGYQGIQLMNVYGATLPGTLAQTTLDNAQAFHDPDGFTYYVVSADNPGVANWLDTGGLDSGEILARYQNTPGDTNAAIGLPVTTEVVPVDDVKQYLPADTPTVTPAQYAADMNERVLSLDYALDTSRESNSSWVTEQLWLHDLQTAMGTSQFDAVFGAEPSTPMWLRLTPALSPDMTTVTKDIVTDPTASLTAIQANLALAENDIAMPITLADQLLQQDFTQTADAVQTAISSGDLQGVLQALDTGGQQFGSILNDALFDPNTSITAGILNARDDLATAIMTANGGFPTQADPVATWEWANMTQLHDFASDLSSLLNPTTAASDLSSVLNDLGTLLNPADLATMF